MIIIGNVFLTLASLIYGVMFYAMYLDDAKGNDASMGYGYLTIAANLAFFVCMAISTICIAKNDGFDWLPQNYRYLMVTVGLVSILITNFLFAISKYENPLSHWIKGFMSIIPGLLPLLILLSGFILLNEALRVGLPVLVYKLPLAVISALSVLICLSGLVFLVIESVRSENKKIETSISDQNRYHTEYLADITHCDPMTGIVSILCFTSRYHDADIHDSAVAKIKENPEWQEALVKILESPYYYKEVYTFLDYNEVPNKTLFLIPLHASILRLAEDIRKEIKTTNNRQHWLLDSYQIVRMLGAVDQFKNMGLDFLPAVRAVRAALDEPVADPVKFDDAPALDSWIKKEGKH